MSDNIPSAVLKLERTFSDCVPASCCPTPCAELDPDEDILPQTKTLDDEFGLLHDVLQECFARLDVLLVKLQMRSTA